MRIRKLKLVKAFSLAATMLGIGLGGACSKKKSESETAADSDIVIAGSLALADSSESALRLAPSSLDELDIYCVSFEIPPVAGTGAVSAEGAFELTLATKDVSVGCFILADEEVLGTIVFEDDSQTDMSGNAKQSDRYAFAGGKTNLGTFTLDLATGKAVVNVADIVREKAADTSGAAAAAIDFTGTYVIKDSGVTLPTGYVGPCEPEGDKKDCEGPPLDWPVYMKLVAGTDVKSGAARHGLMLWDSEELFQACGSKLGFSYDDAKANAGIDLTASGVAEGEFDWDPNLVDGWKDQTATAKHSEMKMENVDDFAGYPGMKQYFKQYRTWTCADGQPCTESNPITKEGFNFFANTKETGCKNSAGEPMQLNDWGNMTCEHEELGGGLNKNTCSKEYEGDTVTCVHIGGIFDSNGTPMANANTRYPDDYVVYANGPYCDTNSNNQRDNSDGYPRWNGDSQSCDSGTLKDGDLCKDIDTSSVPGEMAQLRCFAQAVSNKRDQPSEGGSCSREVRGNWSASTPEEFLGNPNGPAKANGQIFFELFDFTSPTSGTMRGEERRFDGIQVGNSWTDCEVINVFSIALSKYPDSDDLLAEMVETSRNVSAKPACVAEYGEGKTQKMLFKFEKQ